MFGLFKDKSIENSVEIAKNATIEPALQKGSYVAFLVHLRMSHDEILKHWKTEKAVQAFVEEIENRIDSDDFDDPLEQFIGGIAREGDTGKKSALRAVFAPENKLLMKWNK